MAKILKFAFLRELCARPNTMRIYCILNWEYKTVGISHLRHIYFELSTSEVPQNDAILQFTLKKALKKSLFYMFYLLYNFVCRNGDLGTNSFYRFLLAVPRTVVIHTYYSLTYVCSSNNYSLSSEFIPTY